MTKHQLVLDVAGVLITNMSPLFWNEIAELSGASNNAFKSMFNLEIRELFWSGILSEEVFWQWLNEKSSAIEIPHARTVLFKHLQTLPAFEHIPKWSQHADVHLLSNHREEWLLPVLRPIVPYLKSITISSVVGCCKPDAAIYQIVNSKLEPNIQVIFIDDQEKNLKVPQNLNWSTIIEDQEGKWIERVQYILENNQA